jgi:hypothetical protein
MPVPTIKQTTLRIGTVRMKNHKYYQVKKTKSGSKKWLAAPASERKCHNYLKKKISINMSEKKKKNRRIRTTKQALAIAYSQTRRKYSKCHL